MKGRSEREFKACRQDVLVSLDFSTSYFSSLISSVNGKGLFATYGK